MLDSDTSAAIFGDAESGLWGLLVGGANPSLALAPLDGQAEQALAQAALLSEPDGSSLSVSADGSKLQLEVTQPQAATTAETARIQSLHVSGTIRVAGRLRELDAAGVLADLTLGRKAGSARLLGCWFDGGYAIELLSLRPRSARGHDHDSIFAIALGEQGDTVFDPRLSTTYAADGHPQRAAAELWVGNAAEDDDDASHPSRVTGLATGASARTQRPDMRIGAYALRCVRRGQPGAGVYLLAQSM